MASKGCLVNVMSIQKIDTELCAGDIYSVKVECFQDDNDSSAREVLRCASVKEDIDDHQINDSIARFETGDISLVKVEYVQDIDSPATQALGCVSVKKDPVAVHMTNCKADCSAKVHSGSNIGQIMPRHCLLENKIGVLKTESQDQNSSPLQHHSSFDQHNAKMAETRSSSTVWLLGKSEKEIICGGLPTKGHTLQKMVYHHIQEHHTVRESAKLSVQAVCAYWEKARIPVQRVDSCERQLLKLYDAYKLVKKNRTKTFENYRVKEQMFKDDLQSLFDISPNDALEKMTNEEDKAFLIMQREDPSSSRMGSVDNTLAVKENRKRIRLENEDK
uniref:uncharacterized protein isoform X1 n=1 Tax=Myxine glutinosa TaxID=7769 RepID=UPI00358EBC5F